MRFAYADPPYLGCCALYGHEHGPEGRCWDDPETHRLLVVRLCNDFPDGWAMSASSPSLWTLLPMCPPDVRVGGWFKSFASFKPNVNPAYAWEPMLFRGGRRRSRDVATVRDWVCVPITVQKGLTGAKPPKVCTWVLDLLGYEDGDELIDLFPGTGVMGRVLAQGRLAV